MPSLTMRCPCCDADLGQRARCLACDVVLVPVPGEDAGWLAHLGGVIRRHDDQTLELTLPDGRDVDLQLDPSTRLLPGGAPGEPGTPVEALVALHRSFEQGGPRQAAIQQTGLLARVVTCGPDAGGQMRAELARRAPRPSGPADPAIPWPEGLHLARKREEDGWRLVLRVRTRRPTLVYLLVAVAMVLFGGFPFYTGALGFAREPVPFVLSLLSLLALCLIVATPWLLRWSTISLDPRRLTLQRGPTRLLRRTVAPTRAIAAVYTACDGASRWSVEVRDTAGEKTTLLALEETSGIPVLLFTARLLETALGIHDREPVEHEAQPGIRGTLPDLEQALRQAE